MSLAKLRKMGGSYDISNRTVIACLPYSMSDAVNFMIDV